MMNTIPDSQSSIGQAVIQMLDAEGFEPHRIARLFDVSEEVIKRALPANRRRKEP